MEKPKPPVPYDPARHVQQTDGKWRDNVSKRLVSIAKETIPVELRDRAPATAMQGVELPDVPVVAQPSPEELQAAAREGAFGKPAGSLSPAAPQALPSSAGAPSGVPYSFDSIPDIGEQEAAALAGVGGELPHEHIQGCYKGHAEGRMCACGVRVFNRMSEVEAKGNANMVISIMNRFLPNPAPLEPGGAEEAAWVNAFQEISVRYGSPWAAFAPHLAVLGAVVPSVLVRRGTPGNVGPSEAEKGPEESQREVRAEPAVRLAAVELAR